MNFKIMSMVTIFILFSACESSKNKKKVIDNIKLEKQEVISKGIYDIDIEKSIVKWIGRTPVKSHDGTVDVLKGSLLVDAKGILNAEVTIDMNTINCTDLSGGKKNNLEGHLKNDDFFSVSSFPTAKINLSSNLELNEGMINFKGNLEIKKISHPISFKSKLEKTSAGKYKAVSSFSFDRSMYDIKYKSKSFFDDLGDKFINDFIEIDIEIITL